MALRPGEGKEFDPAFLADMPYDPRVLLFDRLLEVDVEKSLVRCRLPTDRPTPFSEHQRTHPKLHPSHMAGAVLVHATGMLGLVHAYHVLGLRHGEGWIGFGTEIRRARFRRLVDPGEPLTATCTATRHRTGATRHLLSYRYEFTRGSDVYFESEQSAVWLMAGGDAESATDAPSDD